MRYPSSVKTKADRRAVDRALRASVQHRQHRALLRDRDGRPLPTRLTLSEEIQVLLDTTNPDEPDMTFHVTLLDPDRRLPIDGSHAADGKVWASKWIQLFTAIWVPDIAGGKWIEWSRFYGRVRSVARNDDWSVALDAVSGDAEHTGRYGFDHPEHVSKGTRVTTAIRHILRQRGETRFDFENFKREVPSGRNWKRGMSPKRAVHNLAGMIERGHVFWDARGVWRFRRMPKKPALKVERGKGAVVFGAGQTFATHDLVQKAIVEGTRVTRPKVWARTKLKVKAENNDTNIRVTSNKHFTAAKLIVIGSGENKRRRKVSSIDGDRIHFTSNDLDRGFPEGTIVRVRHRATRKTKKVGAASRPPWDPLGARALSNGKRPAIEIRNIGEYKKVKDLDKLARHDLKKAKTGADHAVSLTMRDDPRLEQLDLIAVRAIQGVTKAIRMKRVVWEVGVGFMHVDWEGRRPPTKAALKARRKAWKKAHR